MVTVDRDPQRPAPDRDDIEREITQLCADGLDSLAQFLRARGRKLVVLIDQFEEILATDQPPDLTFLDLVFPTKPVENSPIRFVVTLRADFLKPLLDIPGFGPRLQQRTYLLSPLTDDELRDAIERPASVSGLNYQTVGLARIPALPVSHDPAGVCATVGNTLTEIVDAEIVKLLVVLGACGDGLRERADPKCERHAQNGGAHEPTHPDATGKSGRRAGSQHRNTPSLQSSAGPVSLDGPPSLPIYVVPS